MGGGRRDIADISLPAEAGPACGDIDSRPQLGPGKVAGDGSLFHRPPV
jgi:hypothetical protein